MTPRLVSHQVTMMQEGVREVTDQNLQAKRQTIGARLAVRLQGDAYKSREGAPLANGSYYIVVHKPAVFVRSSPTTSAEPCGSLVIGDVVQCDARKRGAWLKLVGREGWVLEDGASLGLGQLLRCLPEGISQSQIWDAQSAYPLLVMCADGLCNRLRIALSFALICRERRRRLIVIWPRSQEAAFGAFSDAFEAIPGVEFVATVPAEFSGHKYTFSPHGSDFHPDIKGVEAREDECYSLLQPNASVCAAVASTLKACGDRFVSIHVRRTDHWGSEVTDSAFETFANAYPDHNVLVATDNALTQAHFLSRFAGRGRVTNRIDGHAVSPAVLRQTSLHDAVVDLYACAAATGPFKGTPTSSYSDTILRLRRLQGCVHPADEHVITDARDQAKVTLHTPGGHIKHSTVGMARTTYPSAQQSTASVVGA